MNTDTVRTLIAYDRWANHRLLAAACLLATEDFNRDLRASFGSIKGTLVHVLEGTWVWLRRWRGEDAVPVRAPNDFADAAALASSWATLDQQQQAFALELTDLRLEAPLTIRGHQYSLVQLIQHQLNHSTYHRGQVALLLRQLGHTPPATDYRVFLIEAG